MRRIAAGLLLSLIGGVAMAQTPPAPTPQPPPSQPASSDQPPAAPKTGMPVAGAPGDGSGQPQEMIVETPEGSFFVRPSQSGGRKPRRDQAQSAEAGTPAGGDDAADDDGMSGRPHMRDGWRSRLAQAKAARFRIRTPSMTLGVKCPEEESMKACVDAISELLDKAAPQPHS